MQKNTIDVISDSFIATFDTIYNGLDWGFASDPNAYNKMYFDATRRDLYIFGEHTATHESNSQLYEFLYKENHIKKRIFEIDDKYYISEVNPRFGGGYPHAYACGVNFPRCIINNLKGKENPVNIGDYQEGVYMMKYNELCILPEDKLAK